MAQLPFVQNFEIDAATSEDLATHYPHIKASAPQGFNSFSLKVENSTLIKEGQAQSDQIYGSQNGLSRITYKIGITCAKGYPGGLGCRVAPVDMDLAAMVGGDDVSADNRLIFTPGTLYGGGGEFRINGTGGFHFTVASADLGFTPPTYELGKRGTLFEIELNKTGKHKVTVTSPVDPNLSYTHEWTNEALWVGDASPVFAIYDGDLPNQGRVFYDHFSVAGE